MYQNQPKNEEELKQLATKVFSLTDLTTLNLDDTKKVVESLCEKAAGGLEKAAAVCVYPEHIVTAKNAVSAAGLNVATVVNFPESEDSLEDVLTLTRKSIKDGVNEVDLVFPFKDLLKAASKPEGITADKYLELKAFVKDVADLCHAHNVAIKVILETGELKDPSLIALAAKASIHAGADFIKTSTGKTAINATPEAAEVMLNEIKKGLENGFKCGLKISGGVKTVEQARLYLALAERIISDEAFLTAQYFRFGASGIYNDIKSILDTGKALASNGDKNSY